MSVICRTHLLHVKTNRQYSVKMRIEHRDTLSCTSTHAHCYGAASIVADAAYLVAISSAAFIR